MVTSTRDNTKTRTPRAKETGTLVGVRFQADPLASLDQWRAKQPGIPSRAEAIRRLVEIGLKAKG